jgi:hypothetical protein
LYNELMKPCLPGASERRRRLRIDLQVLSYARKHPSARPRRSACQGSDTHLSCCEA